MIDLRNQSKQIRYFVLPLLILSIVILLNQWRISRPDTALGTSREYLEGRFPGSNWELAKLALVGEGLGKKWRLEFSSLQKDGRRIQANFLVDRWWPEKIVGRFVLLLGPPQVLDAQWNESTLADRIFSRVTRSDFFLTAILLLALQLLWLYRMYGRGRFRKADGALLAVLGGALMLTLTVLEVHPGFMIAYPLLLALLGLAAGSRGGEEKGPGE